MSRTFKQNPKIEKAWDDWSDEVLIQGEVKGHALSEERGHYYWCFFLANGEQRYCTNAPEHIQAKLGVPKDDRVPDSCLHGSCYWGRKYRATVGDAE